VRWGAASLLVPLLGCGAGSDQVEEDAAVDPFGCETLAGDDGTGEPASLAVGYLEGEAFVELSDGDQAPIVKGSQGLYMLVVQLRTDAAPPADSFCLACQRLVSPSGAFEGLDHSANMTFQEDEGSFLANTALILGGGSDIEAALDGAQVDVSFDCSGHGVQAGVSLGVQLFIPEL
jgi:hypothetical protein